MTKPDSNLRKAAVLLRSLDSDTAAVMLAQLSPAEASSLRAALRDLGTFDPDEQADVVAEFRRGRPAAMNSGHGGVELELSSQSGKYQTELPAPTGSDTPIGAAKRFEFLASAPMSALIPYLAREHAQTIAVVLAHLAPARAAAVLAALPEKMQADTIERLSELGETDPDSITVLERELAAWMATRTEDRGTIARRRETVANILAAADPKTRRGILSKLEHHNVALAEQLGPRDQAHAANTAPPKTAERRYRSKQASETKERIRARLATLERQMVDPPPAAPRPAPRPQIEFEQLVHLDSQSLSALLRDVDPNVLAIALAGSDDSLVDRICEQMPKRVGRKFRRGLRKLGPTRLSDVDEAQRAVADVATRQLRQRRKLATARN